MLNSMVVVLLRVLRKGHRPLMTLGLRRRVAGDGRPRWPRTGPRSRAWTARADARRRRDPSSGGASGGCRVGWLALRSLLQVVGPFGGPVGEVPETVSPVPGSHKYGYPPGSPT